MRCPAAAAPVVRRPLGASSCLVLQVSRWEGVGRAGVQRSLLLGKTPPPLLRLSTPGRRKARLRTAAAPSRPPSVRALPEPSYGGTPRGFSRREESVSGSAPPSGASEAPPSRRVRVKSDRAGADPGPA